MALAHNFLLITNRQDSRQWLEKNSRAETECWLVLKRGRPREDDLFYYLDAVEEALCFGWVDSTLKKSDGQTWQRFSLRKPKSNWTTLNKARVKRLGRLGLMTDHGRAVLLPDLSVSFDPAIVQNLKETEVWVTFSSFPTLYQEVKLSNLAFYKSKQPASYQKMLDCLIEKTRQGKLYGDWNDYGGWEKIEYQY